MRACRSAFLITWLALWFGAAADAQERPPAEAGAPQVKPAPANEFDQQLRELEKLRKQQAEGKDEAEKLRKLVELQQKQIDVLEKMVRLVAGEIKSRSEALDGRLEQAAVRDQELANATDDLREQADAQHRSGPVLPATLREQFLPTRTNESPLAIYGTLATDFQDFQERNGNFPSPVFSPHFYLLLNERFLLEVNPEFRENEVQLESAQLDWFLHDNLTLVFGRFYSPLGFFNERLHTSWIFKTPDRPLLFQQVFPSPLSFNGLQARGAAYLGELPVKLEYCGLVANGISLPVLNPTARDFADFRAMKDTFDDANNGKALGGRLGLSFPTVGAIVGVSGLANGAYDRAGQHDLSVWDVDCSFHHGNWDFRFEYARTHQQAPLRPIKRQGWYAQIAYRPYDCLHPVLQKLEGVFRYDCVKFEGIDLTATGLDFEPRERIPIDRIRYTFGVNFYAYASLIFKVAYEISDEQSFTELRDNGFIAQVSWGF